jgi:hypothetical protein
VTGSKGRRRKQLLNDFKETRGYCILKEEALECNLWRTRFGRATDLSYDTLQNEWMNEWMDEWMDGWMGAVPVSLVAVHSTRAGSTRDRSNNRCSYTIDKNIATYKAMEFEARICHCASLYIIWTALGHQQVYHCRYVIIQVYENYALNVDGAQLTRIPLLRIITARNRVTISNDYDVFFKIYVTGCIKFQTLVLLPEDGGRRPEHVREETVVLHTHKCANCCFHNKKHVIQHWM